VRCALGKAGVIAAADKREGDNKSPVGAWPIREVLYRPDVYPDGPDRAADQGHGARRRLVRRAGRSGLQPPVKLPYPASAERMWRDDQRLRPGRHAGHNDDPPVPGLGSAIFLHLARDGYPGTEGCVALAREDLEALLAAAEPGDAKPGDAVEIACVRRTRPRLRAPEDRRAHPHRGRAPQAMAISKSSLMPIDSFASRCAPRWPQQAKNAGRDPRRPAECTSGPPRQVQAPAQGDEAVGLARRDAGLLRLLADIDLDEQARRPALGLDLVGQGAGQLLAVQALDHVEEGHGVAALLVCSGPIRRSSTWSRRSSSAHGLLDAIFAEHPLASVENRRDMVPGLQLGHRHQRDRVGRRPAARAAAGCGIGSRRSMGGV
jgi:hypothetical protein